MSNTFSQMHPKFERLRFVLGQADSGEAQIVRDSLKARGIGHIAECNGNADRLLDTLDAEIVDLIVYDYELQRERFAEMMQFIRKKARGKNPFVLIVATVGESDSGTVRHLARAGIDDLIRRPVTGARLAASVDQLMERRRPFLVTRDYVGPSRRFGGRSDRAGDNALIQVPNTMRARAVDNVTESELERIVQAAVANLRDKQIVAAGFDLAFIARQMIDAYASLKEGPGRAEDVRRLLTQLEGAAAELMDRCRAGQFERIADLAKMVIALTERLGRGSLGRAGVEVQLVGKLAEAIRRAVVTERESADTMRDIAATIGTFTGGEGGSTH